MSKEVWVKNTFDEKINGEANKYIMSDDCELIGQAYAHKASFLAGAKASRKETEPLYSKLEEEARGYLKQNTALREALQVAKGALEELCEENFCCDLMHPDGNECCVKEMGVNYIADEAFAKLEGGLMSRGTSRGAHDGPEWWMPLVIGVVVIGLILLRIVTM